MRLCVETYLYFVIISDVYAAASVRLCVETSASPITFEFVLAAASVRLCVETSSVFTQRSEIRQPPPCGCVLKL